MEKPNFYSILPAVVRYDNDLKPNEKLLYSEITALMDKNGFCWASNKYFAALYGVEKETVSRWINHLKEKKYIDIELTRNDKKEIEFRKIYTTVFNNNAGGIDEKVNRVLTKESRPYCEKNQPPIDKKVKENNTRYINTSITNINIENNKEQKENKKPKTKRFNELIMEYSDNPEIKVLLFDFLDMRREIKRPMTNKAFVLLLKKLDRLTNDDKIKVQILEKSIENSWLSVYPLNDNFIKKVNISTDTKKTNNIFLEMLMETEEVE